MAKDAEGRPSAERPPLRASRRIPPFEPRSSPVESFPLRWAVRTGLSAWIKDLAFLLVPLAAICLPAVATVVSVRRNDDLLRPWELPTGTEGSRLAWTLLIAGLPLAHGLLASLAASAALRRLDTRVSRGAALVRALRATVPCTLALCAETWIAPFYLTMALFEGGLARITVTWLVFGNLFLCDAALVACAPYVAEGLGFRRGRRRDRELWQGLHRRRGGLMILPVLAYVALLLVTMVFEGRPSFGFANLLPAVLVGGFVLTTMDAAIGAAAYVHRRGVVDGAPVAALAAVFE